MSTINNGGPAFPVPLNEGQPYNGHGPCDGMTLRDYFAAKAMSAMITHHGIYDEEQPVAAMTSATAQDYHADSVGKIAYAYADSMLRAREGGAE